MNRIIKATLSNSFSFFIGLATYVLVAAAIYVLYWLFSSDFAVFSILILTATAGILLRLFSHSETLKDIGTTLVAIPPLIVISIIFGFNELIYLY